MEVDDIYKKLFLNLSDGIIIINKNLKIMSINNMAKTILQDEIMAPGDKITNYINARRIEKSYQEY